MPAKRIAIVGFGPRGLGALERLVAHHGERESDPIEVTVFEPHPTPGAGSAYDPNQEPYLLMNFPAAKIDMNWRSEGTPSALEVGSFCEWSGTDPDRASDWYPPRALVGKYISSVAESLLDSAPFPVELVKEPVDEIRPDPPGWQVVSPTRSCRFEQVLLAVGHASSGPTSSPPPDLTAETHVDIRGFGLTAIDLILELTEGRGAVPGPVILPHSRHGRPMLVKPELARSPVSREAALASIEASRESLCRLPPDRGVEQLGEAVGSLAGDLLGLNVSAAADEWIRSACGGRLDADEDPAASIARSLRIATGESPPDLGWALGLAWRSIYPAIVDRFSHGGMPASDLGSFRLLATELERLAFGPPPVNGAKLVSLIEAGVLDLSELDQSAGDPSRIQLDAVSAPPGLQVHQLPLSGLFASGSVRIPLGARGVEVTREAFCVGADGRPTEGLAAVGRATEDWVIGNDTLDRTLHPEIDGWAAAMCRARRAPVTAGVAS